MGHMMLASAANVPELKLDEQEAAQLAKAVARVANEYDAVMTAISPKTAAWLALAQTAGFVYGPRVIAFRMRQKAENAQPVN